MRKLNFDKLYAASKGRMRDINEVIVLNLIRDQQPISRADITRKTGLQMSTVTVITKRLINKQLIYEQGVAPSNGGRKPRLLGLRTDRVRVFGVDIGVTETTLALADFNGMILDRKTFTTDHEAEPFLNRLVDEIERVMKSSRYEIEYEGVGVSATGIIDSGKGKIVFSPNLGWKEVELRAIFEKRLNLPVYVENDARTSALAEIWHGNGKSAGSENLVFVTVNEGVGSGIILHGQLYRGSSGGAGEFGHLSLDQRGPECNCGNRGCWELYASDRATVRRFLELSKASRPPSDARHSLPLTAAHVVALAAGGDKAALASIKTTAKYLGMGIANIINSFNPEMVVVGGEINKAWEIIEPIIQKNVEAKVFKRNFACARIVASNFEDKASLMGAILQALSTKLAVAKVA